MPIAIDPEATFPLILPGDVDKPIAEQPRFIYRNLTARQWLAVCNSLDKMDECKTNEDLITLIFDGCRTGLVGWENMGRKFNPNELEDVLTFIEATQLLVALKASSLPSLEKKTPSESLSESDTAQSVKIAPDPTGAGTNQQN